MKALTSALVFTFLAGVVMSQSASPSSESVARGGALYDNWLGVLNATAPTADNPLWASQKTNARKGAATYRCRECHGWDYKGKDGAYATGDHKTGFPGIQGAVNKTPEELTAILRDKEKRHDFGSLLGEADIKDLVAFIQNGVRDISKLLNASGKAAKPNLVLGKKVFSDSCALCHGDDGKKINFHAPPAEPEFVGTIASEDALGFYHRVQYGVPGKPMPAFYGKLKDDELMALLSYAATLPEK